MIRVKLAVLADAMQGALPKAANIKGLSWKATYDGAKLLKNIAGEFDAFRAAQRALYDRYGDKNGDKITIRPDCLEDFRKELTELLEQEVEVKGTPIELPKLREPKEGEEPAPAELTPAEIMACGPFVVIPGEPDAADKAKDGNGEKGTDA